MNKIKILKGFTHKEAIAWIAKQGTTSKFSVLKRLDSDLYDIDFHGSSLEYESFCNRIINNCQNNNDEVGLVDEIFGQQGYEYSATIDTEVSKQDMGQNTSMSKMDNSNTNTNTNQQNEQTNLKQQVHELISLKNNLKIIDSAIASLKSSGVPIKERLDALKVEASSLQASLVSIEKDLKSQSEHKIKLLERQEKLTRNIAIGQEQNRIVTTNCLGTTYTVLLTSKDVVIQKQVVI